MNDEAAQEIQATIARMREKAQGKRVWAENLGGQLDQTQKRIVTLLTEAADLDQGADAIENVFMAGLKDV